ncbi:MAG: YeeE/YedE family protein [Flavobacteriales bacterium]
MLEFLSQPWPWYVAGPLIGLMIPLLLIAGNKPFGVSSSLRHICAAALPKISDYFKYDWKKKIWNLLFVAGIALGGFIAANFLTNPNAIDISQETKSLLKEWGIIDFNGYIPSELYSWENLSSSSLILLIGGGLLIGFGTRYANGCTSGHSIYGLAQLSWVSLVATTGFFIGGLIASWIILPLILA